MTFLQKAKRFFAPLEWEYLLVTLSILKFSLWAIYALFSVYIMKESVHLYSISDTEGIKKLIWWYMGFSIMYIMTAYILRRSDWPKLWHQIQRWIYRNYLKELFLIDWNTFEKIWTWRLISIITTWEKVWIDTLNHVMQQWVKVWIVTGYILYLFFRESFYIGIIFIVIFIWLHALVVHFDSLARKHRAVRSTKRTDITREVVRMIMARNDIIQTSRIQKDIDTVMKITYEMQDANNGINHALFLIFNLVRIVSISMRILFLWALIYYFQSWNITVAEIAWILWLFIVFESFLFDSTEFYKNFTKDFSDIEKLWETFDNAPRLKWYSDGKIFSLQRKDLEIQDIDYAYDEKKVFEDFSLSIRYGKKTAFVGASGWGKTTLIKLIAGYLHPEKWSISVMGNTLSETALKSYYPHIWYLTQDPSVFDATIRENLISALPESTDTAISEELLISALRYARCDFVFEMRDGLDTEIWERWVRLSGGQKQRLAIAKIFLKNPEIILLDEPTSALDSFSEEKITEALDTLFEGRTVIIVAHRLQTVKKADDIIVIEWGKVLERWVHSSLVEKWGVYAKMLELQSGF